MNILRIRRDIFLECNLRRCRAPAALDRDFHGISHGVAVYHFLKVGRARDFLAVQRYEPVTGLEEGRPLLVRQPENKLTLPNFMRAQLYAAMATLQIGMELLWAEDVQVEKLYGHGGLFKTKGVGQKLLAGALGVPVAVMETAGEGGPWGMALLAAYLAEKRQGQTLESWLDRLEPLTGNWASTGISSSHGIE